MRHTLSITTPHCRYPPRLGARAMSVVLILVACLLNGCLVRVAYNNADTIIRWELDRYFNLEGEQEQLLATRLPDHLNWHRAQQLPQIIALLRRAHAALDAGLTDEELLHLLDGADRLRQGLVDRLLVDGSELFAQLTPEQVEHLRRKLANANEEWEERIERSTDQRREDRAERILAQVEKWTGDLSKAQRAELVQAADGIPDILDTWLAHRKARQHQFVALVIQARTDGVAAQSGLNDYFNEPEPKIFSAHRDAVRAFILAGYRISTVQQRIHAQRRLQKWIDGLASFLPADTGRPSTVPK